MKNLYKVWGLGMIAVFFAGCSTESSVDYVRTTQFQALEKKIEILESEKKKGDDKYVALEKKIVEKDSGVDDKQEKILILEKKIDDIQMDVDTIKKEFAENNRVSGQQIIEIDRALQKLEQIKNHYLSNYKNINELGSNEETELKASAPENKVIDLEKEAQKIRDKEKEHLDSLAEQNGDLFLEKKKVLFQEEKVIAGLDFLIFSFCENHVCEKYLIEKTLFSQSKFLPSEVDTEYFISGKIEYTGEISDEKYYKILGDFNIEVGSSVSVNTSFREDLDNVSM